MWSQEQAVYAMYAKLLNVRPENLGEACAASGASALRGPGGPGGPGGQGQSPKTLALGPWGPDPPQC